jgi:hypothetical protein
MIASQLYELLPRSRAYSFYLCQLLKADLLKEPVENASTGELFSFLLRCKTERSVPPEVPAARSEEDATALSFQHWSGFARRGQGPLLQAVLISGVKIKKILIAF